MQRRHLVLVPLVFVSAACEAPLFPHAPTATVISHTMSCRQFADSPKNTTFCTAVARWSDDGPGEVTGPFAAWESSNPAVGTTPPCRDQGFPRFADRIQPPYGCGVITHVASGSTEIRATFGGVTAVYQLAIAFIPN